LIFVEQENILVSFSLNKSCISFDGADHARKQMSVSFLSDCFAMSKICLAIPTFAFRYSKVQITFIGPLCTFTVKQTQDGVRKWRVRLGAGLKSL